MATISGTTSKVAIVGGGAGAIGWEICTKLTSADYRVVYGDIDASALCPESGIVGVTVDLSHEDGARMLVDTALKQFGRVDAVVNGVGVLSDRPTGFMDMCESDWILSFKLNFLSAVYLSKAALPHLAETHGSVVNISSAAAHEPSPFAPDYAVMKTALLSFSKIIAVEWGSHGVRCNSITPGPIRTDAFLTWMNERAAREGVTIEEAICHYMNDVRRSALGGPGTVTDVAELVLFLVSERSGYITGSDYRIDGGVTQGL